ncbi:Alcohol dehydrogenase GroES-like domain-containing protein [Cladophialophora immunda]|nr:Alcohol dehydrogenase GroES-like domain-containing protein [Cladophialophora immunda]
MNGHTVEAHVSKQGSPLAVRYHGNKDVRVEKMPLENQLREGQIRLSPAWCGICGTDVHEYLNGPVFPPTADAPTPLTGDTLPITLGHEFSGTVTQVHPSVKSLKAGDKVAVEGLLTDDTCYACSIHKRNICDKSAFLGLSANPGGLCESIAIPASACHKLPNDISLEFGALVEPLSVAWHAVSNSGIKPGQSALVLGAGPIGLAVILCLKAKGVSKILASEPCEARYENAATLGAIRTINPTSVDVVAEAKAFCESIGPDFAFDASGVQATITDGIKAVRKYGTYYNIALWGKPATIDVNELLFNGKTIKSDLSYARGDYESVIKAISTGEISRAHLELLITAKIDMEDFVEKGIQELINFKDKHIKILVRVDKSQSLDL